MTAPVERHKYLSIAFAMVVIPIVAAVVFRPYLDSPFMFDDIHTIRDNVHIKHHLSPLYFLAHPESASVVPHTLIRPLLTFSYALDYHFDGPDPKSFRLTNLILHVINALIIVGLTRSTKRLKPMAPFAGLIFLVLPLNSINVAYISCRSVLLSSAFYLGALLAFSRTIDNPMIFMDKKWRGFIVFAIASLFMTSLLIKSVAATLPAAIIIWYWLFGDSDNWRKDAFRARQVYFLSVLSAMACVFAAYMAYRHYFSAPTLFPNARPWPVWQYISAQSVVIWRYVGMMGIPVNLSIEHDAWMPVAPDDLVSLTFLASVAGIVAVLFLAFHFRRILPEASFAILFGFIYLSPTSSIVPLVMVVNANRPYLSSLAFVWLLLLTFNIIFSRKGRGNLGYPIMTIIIVLLSVVTWERSSSFQDQISLWRGAVESAPSLSRPYINLGLAYKRLGRVSDAERMYTIAITIDNCSSSAMVNLGNLKKDQGDIKGAEELWLGALKCDAHSVPALLNLAQYYSETGQETKAEELYIKAKTIWPHYADQLLDKR